MRQLNDDERFWLIKALSKVRSKRRQEQLIQYLVRRCEVCAEYDDGTVHARRFLDLRDAPPEKVLEIRGQERPVWEWDLPDCKVTVYATKYEFTELVIETKDT